MYLCYFFLGSATSTVFIMNYFIFWSHCYVQSIEHIVFKFFEIKKAYSIYIYTHTFIPKFYHFLPSFKCYFTNMFDCSAVLRWWFVDCGYGFVVPTAHASFFLVLVCLPTYPSLTVTASDHAHWGRTEALHLLLFHLKPKLNRVPFYIDYEINVLNVEHTCFYLYVKLL